MADRSSQLVLSALTRAAADAAGVPLFASKNRPGLFPTTHPGKQAARRCCDEGYLLPAAANGTTGKSPPVCTLTEKGMSYLLGQVSPRQVLEDFVRILEEREGQIEELLGVVRKMQAGMDSLRGAIAAVLSKVNAPAGDLKALFAEFRQEKTPASPADPSAAVVAALEDWAKAATQEDCPLPELYRRLEACCPGLTVGSFHDALRRLHASGQVWLHPWTGPLYQVPEPPFSLLVGHEIAYYASVRS
jgi:hypothetical protein